MGCDSQRSWNEPTIPHMGKRAVPEIMAQTGKLNTLDIPARNAKFWLLILKVFD